MVISRIYTDESEIVRYVAYHVYLSYFSLVFLDVYILDCY